MFVELSLTGSGAEAILDTSMLGSELCIFLGNDHSADRVNYKHSNVPASDEVAVVI